MPAQIVQRVPDPGGLGGSLMSLRDDWTMLYGDETATRIRLRAPGKPLFGRRRSPNVLTAFGWFIVLCVGAMTFGAALAIAI